MFIPAVACALSDEKDGNEEESYISIRELTHGLVLCQIGVFELTLSPKENEEDNHDWE